LVSYVGAVLLHLGLQINCSSIRKDGKLKEFQLIFFLFTGKLASKQFGKATNKLVGFAFIGTAAGIFVC